MEKLIEEIPQNFAVLWIVMLLVVVALLIKILPKLVSTFNKLRKQVNELENISTSVKKNTEDLAELQNKIGQDFIRINNIEKFTAQQQNYINDSIEERELIMRSLIGVLQGLQEIGANGPTKKSEAEIQAYLLKKSHKSQTLGEG